MRRGSRSERMARTWASCEKPQHGEDQCLPAHGVRLEEPNLGAEREARNQHADPDDVETKALPYPVPSTYSSYRPHATRRRYS